MANGLAKFGSFAGGLAETLQRGLEGGRAEERFEREQARLEAGEQRARIQASLQFLQNIPDFAKLDPEVRAPLIDAYSRGVETLTGRPLPPELRNALSSMPGINKVFASAIGGDPQAMQQLFTFDPTGNLFKLARETHQESLRGLVPGETQAIQRATPGILPGEARAEAAASLGVPFAEAGVAAESVEDREMRALQMDKIRQEIAASKTKAARDQKIETNAKAAAWESAERFKEEEARKAGKAYKRPARPSSLTDLSAMPADILQLMLLAPTQPEMLQLMLSMFARPGTTVPGAPVTRVPGPAGAGGTVTPPAGQPQLWGRDPKTGKPVRVQ